MIPSLAVLNQYLYGKKGFLACCSSAIKTGLFTGLGGRIFYVCIRCFSLWVRPIRFDFLSPLSELDREKISVQIKEKESQGQDASLQRAMLQSLDERDRREKYQQQTL